MTVDADALNEAPPTRLDIPICRDYIAAALAMRAEGAGDNDAESNSDGSPGTMFGFFSTFNDWYEINSFWEGSFVERIAPGAFKRTIKNRSGETPVRALFDHGFDPQLGDKPLGIPEVLEERDKGPYQETPLFRGVPDMVVEGLRQGAYSQSFRFRVLADNWVEEKGAKGWDESIDEKWSGVPQRTITEVRLIEFGPTPFPANPNADVGLRSATDQFYESLKRRDPAAVEAALKRTVELRSGLLVPAGSSKFGDLEAKGGDREKIVVADNKPPADDKVPARSGNHVPSEADTTEDPSATHSTDSPKGTPKTRVPARHSAAPTPNTKQGRDSVMADDSTLTAAERSARQGEIRERLTEIDSEYNGAALPDEIQTEWNNLNTEFDEHEVAIAADVARKERIKTLAARGDGERVDTSAPVLHRRPDNPFDLTAIRQQARSLDEMPHLYRENALRVIDEMRFHPPRKGRRTISQDDCKEQLRHVLDFVDDDKGTLARRILVTGSPTYQRAFGKYCMTQSTMTLTSEEQRALAIGAGGTGGFAVPVQLDPTLILVSAGSVNPLRQVCRVEQIVGKEWDGVTTTGITVARAAEAAQSSDNAPALLQPTVKAERVQGFVPFSFEVDQDWNALQSEMTRLLADAKDQEEATSFVTGNGASPAANGLLDPIVGILAANNVNFVTITAAAVYGLENAMNTRFRPNASFMASKTVYNAIRQLDTAGGAQMWERIGAGQPPELLGYPAYEMSTFPANAVPALNDRWLVLGDFSEFLIVDRVGMTVDLIPHLFGANQRPTGQRGIYAFWRNNSKMLVSDAFRAAFRNV